MTGSVTHARCQAQVKRGWGTEELPGQCSRDRASIGRVERDREKGVNPGGEGARKSQAAATGTVCGRDWERQRKIRRALNDNI